MAQPLLVFFEVAFEFALLFLHLALGISQGALRIVQLFLRVFVFDLSGTQCLLHFFRNRRTQAREFFSGAVNGLLGLGAKRSEVERFFEQGAGVFLLWKSQG